MEKVATKSKRREREALLGLALAQCRVDQVGREVDGVITAEIAEAPTETAKDPIEDDQDHDPREVEDHIAVKEVATDHAPAVEDVEGLEVETTHDIREEDEIMEKSENKAAAGPRNVAT